MSEPDVPAALLAALQEIAEPLLAGGWSLFSTETDEGGMYGYSVFYDLERDGVLIELEYYERGDLVAYPTGAEPNEDGVTEPYFVLTRPTREDCWAAFAERGWL